MNLSAPGSRIGVCRRTAAELPESGIGYGIVSRRIPLHFCPQYLDDYVGHVVSAARSCKGGIILMHEIHRNTVKQLEAVITRLLAEGFVFGSLLDPEFQSSLR